MDLVECQPAKEAAIAVARVQVAHLRPPAIDGLHAAGGTEDDLAVRRVNPLIVGETQAKGQLPHPAGRGIELVEMIVILVQRFFPGKQHFLPVVGDVGIAEHAAGIVDQREPGRTAR